jgi:hypothetical protein
MKAKLIQILKTIASDVRQASVPAILLWLAGGAGGLLYVYKMAVDGITQTINKPTPIWASISLIFLCCLYSYVNTNRKTHKYYELSQSSLPPQKGNNQKSKFIFHNNLLWLIDDLNPFCPVCYETKDKKIHMFHRDESSQYEDFEYYECHNCSYRADPSDHPDVPF